MSFSTSFIDISRQKQKTFLPAHFWNGLMFGSAIWALLILGAVFTDYALKLIA